MTHFVGMVVANNEQELNDILAPYSEHLRVEPYFKQIDDLEKMIEKYGTSNLEELCDFMPDWEDEDGVIVDGKLGYMSTYNKDSKWDWWVIGGRWDEMVPANVCFGSDVQTFFDDYCIEKGYDSYIPSTLVDSTGWYSTKDWGWWGAYAMRDESAINEYNTLFEKHKHSKMYIVDFHI